MVYGDDHPRVAPFSRCTAELLGFYGASGMQREQPPLKPLLGSLGLI
jgi:hypothetical protein